MAGGVSYGALVQMSVRRVPRMKCRDCGLKVDHRVPDNECLCPPCREKALSGMTVYDRTMGGALPPNLARLYGRAL